MTRTEIEQRLKIMAQDRLFLHIKPEEIGNDDNLIEKFNVDSVALLELVVGLEADFGIIVEDDNFDVATFSSISSLANFVEERLK